MRLLDVYSYENMRKDENPPVLRKAYLLVEGSYDTQMDVVNIIRKAAKEKDGELFEEVTYHLSSIADRWDVLFYSSLRVSRQFVVLHWEDNVVDEKVAKEIFEQMKKSRKRRYMVVNESSSMKDLFKGISTRSSGVVVNCNPPMQKERMVEVRYNLEKGSATAALFAEMPVGSILNTFRIMEHLGVESVDSRLLNDLDLLRGNVDYWLAYLLVRQGRYRVLNHKYFKDIDSSRFFACTQKFLREILRVKGVEGRVSERQQKLDMKPFQLKFYEGLAKKMTHRNLLRRFFLCLRYGVYKRYPQAHLLLLHYW